jgi:tetratricopeptide (TPR) repeat protein
MINFKTRMPIPILIGIAFGIFFTLSCSSFQQSSSDDSANTTLENYQEQLEEINNRLTNDPQNRELQIQKAEILYGITSSVPDPSQRTVYYQNLRDIANTQRQTGGEVHPRLKEIITKAWSSEQGDGIRLLQLDRSDYLDQQFTRISAHFGNAIVINPDSLVTYNLLANTYYRHGDLNDAISTLETAAGISGDLDMDIGEKLAYLYLESGDIENSISLYKELNTQNPSDPHIRHGLANAYILNQQHTEAIGILRSLTEDYPSRFEYKEALATELYFLLSAQLETVKMDGDDTLLTLSAAENSMNLIDEISELFDSLDQNLPASEEQMLRAASFYHKTGIQLSELIAYSNPELSDDLENRYIGMFEEALPLWEKLADNNPGNLNYVRNLYDIYVRLDMDEEAENLQRSFNL